MHHQQVGLLKASVQSVVSCFRTNAQFRASTLVLVPVFFLASASLAIIDQAFLSAALVGFGPRILAFFLVPQEFLLYDVLLGKEEPRASLLKMYFDGRLLGYAWRYPIAVIAFLLPGLLISMATGWCLGWSNGEPLRIALVILSAVVIAGLALSLCLRLIFFPLFIAMRQPKALAASFRATKGKVWQTTRAMSLPFAALLALYLLAHGAGMLAGKVNAIAGAALALIEICLIVFVTAAETALLTHTYKRIVAPKMEEESTLYAPDPFAADATVVAAHGDGKVGDLTL